MLAMKHHGWMFAGAMFAGFLSAGFVGDQESWQAPAPVPARTEIEKSVEPPSTWEPVETKPIDIDPWYRRPDSQATLWR